MQPLRASTQFPRRMPLAGVLSMNVAQDLIATAAGQTHSVCRQRAAKAGRPLPWNLTCPPWPRVVLSSNRHPSDLSFRSYYSSSLLSLSLCSWKPSSCANTGPDCLAREEGTPRMHFCLRTARASARLSTCSPLPVSRSTVADRPDGRRTNSARLETFPD